MSLHPNAPNTLIAAALAGISPVYPIDVDTFEQQNMEEEQVVGDDEPEASNDEDDSAQFFPQPQPAPRRAGRSTPIERANMAMYIFTMKSNSKRDMTKASAWTRLSKIEGVRTTSLWEFDMPYLTVLEPVHTQERLRLG